MKVMLFLLSLFTFAVGSACEDPAANKVRATTSQSSMTAGSVKRTSEVKGERFVIGPENSKILFTGSKVTGKHDGGFNNFTGEVVLVNSKPEESAVSVEIDVTSVFTDTDGLTRHLQTGDFFEVGQFPKAEFVSTTIQPDGSKAGSYFVTGDLEMRGVRKAVTFPADITIQDDSVTVFAEFSLNRRDFGILYDGKADDLIRDDVVIKLDLKAQRQR